MVRRVRSWGAVACLLLFYMFLSGGCEEPDQEGESPVTVSEEDGVRLVRIPDLHELTLPNLSAEALYSTRSIAGDTIDLFRVRDGLFLEDGSLVIADGGADELILIGDEGVSWKTCGGRGDGPGEFKGLRTLIPRSGGGFYAWDYRLSAFDRNMGFVETITLTPEEREVSIEPLRITSDGSITALDSRQLFFEPMGERRDTVSLMMFSGPAGTTDTIGIWMGLERAFHSMPSTGTFTVPISFGRTVFYSSNGESVAISSTDSVDLTVIGEGAETVLRVVGPGDQIPVTGDSRRAWEENVLEKLPFEIPDLEQAWEEGPARETLPGFEGLELDPDGRLWVGQATVPGDPTRRWIVFDPGGVPRGVVALPTLWPGYLPGTTELLAVGKDRIAVLRRNEFDEEVVEVWRVSH